MDAMTDMDYSAAQAGILSIKGNSDMLLHENVVYKQKYHTDIFGKGSLKFNGAECWAKRIRLVCSGLLCLHLVLF